MGWDGMGWAHIHVLEAGHMFYVSGAVLGTQSRAVPCELCADLSALCIPLPDPSRAMGTGQAPAPTLHPWVSLVGRGRVAGEV